MPRVGQVVIGKTITRMVIFGRVGGLWFSLVVFVLLSVSYTLEVGATYKYDANCNCTLDIKVLLYTRAHYPDPEYLMLDEKLNTNINLNTKKPTKVLIHGFNQNYWKFAKPFVIGRLIN